MKRNINHKLPVKITGVDSADIRRIDFIFKQQMSESAEAVKEAVYLSDGTGDVQKRDGVDVYDIPFSDYETLKFMPSHAFYMDTKIHLTGTSENPITPIIQLTMHPTLFAEDYDG